MDGLQEAGARLHIGHSVLNLKGSDGSRLPNAIVVSSAIPPDNVEILHAKSAGVPVLVHQSVKFGIFFCFNSFLFLLCKYFGSFSMYSHLESYGLLLKGKVSMKFPH